jgi:hypothetical protein
MAVQRTVPLSATAFCNQGVELCTGKLVQLSGAGALTVALAVARQFLARYGTVLPWVLSGETVPYPPDLERGAVPLGRVVWFTPEDSEGLVYTVDTLSRSGTFPLVCVDIRDFSAFGPGALARFMHRARHTGTTLLFLTSIPLATPAPAIAYHFDIEGDEDFRRRIVVRRSRIPLVDGYYNVSPSLFLL